MTTVDLELKKQFQELQMKVVETRSKMRQIDATIDVLNRGIQRYRLTTAEVNSLEPNVTTYQSMGRMFVKARQDDIKKDLEAAIELNTERIQELEKNKGILQKSLKDKENNLREIVSQKQQRAP